MCKVSQDTKPLGESKVLTPWQVGKVTLVKEGLFGGGHLPRKAS